MNRVVEWFGGMVFAEVDWTKIWVGLNHVPRRCQPLDGFKPVPLQLYVDLAGRLSVMARVAEERSNCHDSPSSPLLPSILSPQH